MADRIKLSEMNHTTQMVDDDIIPLVRTQPSLSNFVIKYEDLIEEIKEDTKVIIFDVDFGNDPVTSYQNPVFANVPLINIFAYSESGTNVLTSTNASKTNASDTITYTTGFVGKYRFVVGVALGSSVPFSIISGNPHDNTALAEELDQRASKFGRNYTILRANGTPQENGTELHDIKEAVKTTGGWDENNRFTIVCPPGYYEHENALILDTPYVNLVSLTGEADVVLTRSGDPFNSVNFDDGRCLHVTADNVSVVGIRSGVIQSPNFDAYLSQGEEYALPIQVDELLDNVLFKNCAVGDYSFGGNVFQNRITLITITSRFENITVVTDIVRGLFGDWRIEQAGTIINCDFKASDFMPRISVNGANVIFSGYAKNLKTTGRLFYRATLINGVILSCEGGNQSFFTNIGGQDITGTISNFKGGNECFTVASVSSIFSATLTNILVGNDSFKGTGLEISGTTTDIICGNICFQPLIFSGTFKNILTGTSSFRGGGGRVFSGTFENITSGSSSWTGNPCIYSGVFSNINVGKGGFAGSNQTISGTFNNILGTGSVFRAVPGGSFTAVLDNSKGGANSYTAEVGDNSPKMYYCRLVTGSFQSLSSGGIRISCIDGNNVLINDFET